MSVEQRSLDTLCTSFGRNSDGALGLGAKMARNTKKQFLGKPHVIHPLYGINMVDMSAGQRHCCVVTEDGEVYAWGRDTLGCLGMGFNVNQVVQPTMIDTLAKAGVIAAKVSCGECQTVVISDVGHIWSWGWRVSDMEDFNHDESFDDYPVCHEYAIQFRDVRCGFRYTAGVDIDGKLYTWGNGDCGRLGHGDDEKQLLPKKVRLPDDFDILDIGLGKHFMLALSTDGEVMVWGTGLEGQLGLGPDMTEAFSPTPLTFDHPGKIVGVSCGNEHACVWTDLGEAYTFGKSDNFRLGFLELTGAVYTPTPVAGLRDVRLVKCGMYTSLSLHKDKAHTVRAWGGLEVTDEKIRKVMVRATMMASGGYCQLVYKGIFPESSHAFYPSLDEAQMEELDQILLTLNIPQNLTRQDIKRQIKLLKQQIGHSVYLKDQKTRMNEQRRIELKRVVADPLLGARVNREVQFMGFKMHLAAENMEDRRHMQEKHNKGGAYEENPDVEGLKQYIVFKY